MAYVLAIDLGTTGIRAVVYDASGRALSSAYQKLAISVNSDGWISQDPKEIFDTCLLLANQASTKFSGAIQALGIAAQRGSAVAWDRQTGKALYPLVSWQDQRTLARVQELVAMGIPVNTLAACTKFEWLFQNVPEVADAAASNRLAFGTPDAWLTASFTQQQALVTDCSNAGATGLYDPGGLQWFDMALELFHQDPAWHMQLVGTDATVGVTDLLDCGKNVALTARAGDQQAACFAHHLQAGQAKLTLGTSGMLDVHCGEAAPEEVPGTHALPLWHLAGASQKFCLEASIIAAGASIEWAERVNLIDNVNALSLLEWDPAKDVLFVPALAGLGTPEMARNVRGRFTQLSLATTSQDMLHGVIAGLAHRCADLVDTLGPDHGRVRLNELFVDGGLSQSAALMQGIADYSGLKVLRAVEHEKTVLGIAMLASRNTAHSIQANNSYQEFHPSSNRALCNTQRENWKTEIRALCEI